MISCPPPPPSPQKRHVKHLFFLRTDTIKSIIERHQCTYISYLIKCASTSLKGLYRKYLKVFYFQLNLFLPQYFLQSDRHPCECILVQCCEDCAGGKGSGLAYPGHTEKCRHLHTELSHRCKFCL